MKKLIEAYDYTDELTSRLLTKRTVLEVSSEFNNISDNSERIKFMQKLMASEDLLPTYSNLEVKKSNELANEYRNLGNELYMSRNNYDALLNYNKSLCHADKDGIPLAYFNRSSVYFTMHKYDLCLQNIQLARDNGYPDPEKLNKREAACLENINNKPTPPDIRSNTFMKLTYKPKDIPGVSGCLELAESNLFGRYITTNRNLKVVSLI